MSGGGAERTILYLLQHLNRDLVQPSLALFNCKGPYLKDIPSDVHVHSLESLGDKRSVFLLSRKLQNLIKLYGYDLIHTHLSTVTKPVLRASLLKRFGIPVIATEQNNDLATQGTSFKQAVHTIQMRILYGKLDHITAVSNGLLRQVIHRSRVPAGICSVIPNPVDINKLHSTLCGTVEHSHKTNNNRVMTIVGMGRLVPQKGFDSLIQAFAIAFDNEPVNLVILGEGPLRNDLQALADSLGLQAKFQMPGFVDNPWQIIAQADMFVLPSYWEGHPLALLEAMALGMPVIATSCPFGPEEIIENYVDGRLVSVGDVNGLADAMVQLYKNPKLRSSMAINAKESVKKYDVLSVVRLYQDLYRKFAK